MADDLEGFRKSCLKSDKGIELIMECAWYLIRVSLVADTSHTLEVTRKDDMDATMAIKGELEGVVFISADGDIFPVTRVGDSEADWVGDIVNSGRQGWQCQR